jgi:Na+-driven multidrug efflux pump
VAGQNLGAGKPERSARAVHLAARLGLGVAAFLACLFLLIPDHLLAIFGITDPIVVALGTQLLQYLSVSGFFITVALTFTGGLQGTGDTRGPLYITLVSQVILPMGICFALQQTGRLDAAGIWTAIVLGHATRCALSVWRFEQGKWKQIKVD